MTRTLLALLLILATAAAQERVTLKCATIAPKGSAWMKHLDELNRDVYRRTRGRVRFKFFSGGIAGEEAAVLEKIRYGQLQAGAFTSVGLAAIVPDVRLLELPFTIRDLDEYDAIRPQLTPGLEKKFEEKGFVMLGWSEGGVGHIFSKHRITDMDGVRKARIWLRPGDPMTERVLTGLKLRPIPLAMTDVLTSIQTGLVDTVYASPVALIAVQWHPHVKVMVDHPVVNILAGLVVKKDTFEKISAADRKTVKGLAAKHLKALTARTREDDREARRVLAQKGVEFIEPAPDLVETFRKSCTEATDALTGTSFSKADVERLRRLIREHREKTGKKE